MAVNKVIYGGVALIDLTGDTVTAENLTKGVTAHSASGEQITGTKEESGGSGDTTLNAEIQTISSVTSPQVNFNGTGGTYEVYGYGKGTGSTYQTPKYAFCGSTYYSISYYGNDTSKTLSITIDANGNISGLPSMTSGNLVIVRKP